MPVSHDLDYKQNRLIYLPKYAPMRTLIQRVRRAIVTTREMSLHDITSDTEIQCIFHAEPGISDNEMLESWVWMSSYGWMVGWTHRYMDGDDDGDILGLCWPVIMGGVPLIRWGGDPPLLACDITATLVPFLTNVDTHLHTPCIPYKNILCSIFYVCSYKHTRTVLHTLHYLSVLIEVLWTKCLEQTSTDKQ